MQKNKGHVIKLKKHLTIGGIAAENDQKFLSHCFVDTGDYEALIDTEDDRSILLGRTGCGKSAILEMVKNREENVIEINPEDLALNYISHSNVLSLLEGCGVSLDPFYQLLWKHIFVVELIRNKYGINDDKGVSGFFEGLSNIFGKDKAKTASVEYLTKWQDKFWLPVEERVKEITLKIESQLTDSLNSGGGLDIVAPFFDANVSIGAKKEKLKKLSREEKEEIKDKVQSAVDSVQVQELHRVIKLLGEDVFVDPQQSYYIVIDKIDEDWVEDKTRYKLIRALIETIKTFRKIRTVKFLVAMRVDLLQTVFDQTRDKGFQEDKYRDYILTIRWTAQELEELLAYRVAHMYRRQYEKVDAELYDLLPRQVGSDNAISWLVKRTLMRPRDLIVYINFCLDRAAGNSSIAPSIIRDMEVSYSSERLKAVCQEWMREYPALEASINIIKRKKDGFTHSDIDKDSVDEMANSVLLLDIQEGGEICSVVEGYLNKEMSRSSFLNRLIAVFYTVGIVGIKRDGHETAIWSSLDSPSVTESEVKRSSHFYIHPMFWRALGTHVDKRKS